MYAKVQETLVYTIGSSFLFIFSHDFYIFLFFNKNGINLRYIA